MGELADVHLSKELEMKISVSAGSVDLSLVYSGAQATATMGVKLSVDAFLSQLEAAIPGKLDDAVIEILKAALKAA